ncbi:MAG: EFR1 family ferrodoxin [Anaerolineae bacterium]|jgi:flavodoxin/NAD-dependent dihydropyrimidine dehydrogenase PreA subunit|nr:EFR1 family ferrodoxin [Anaerolineae bacterium]
MDKSVPIFYFSGTGNTWWVAKELADALNNWGFDSKIFSIEQINPDTVAYLVNTAEVVGLGYPIYGSDAPETMKDFIRALPPVKTPKPMMIYVTQLEWSGDGAYFMHKEIEQKGYTIKWAVHFNMPNNIAVDIFPFNLLNSSCEYVEFAEKLIDSAAKVQDLAKKIKENKKWIMGNHPLAWAAAWVQRGPFRWVMGLIRDRLFSVNQKKCIQCSRCENICPVDNVRLNVAGFPEWSDHCILCMRCFNYCPMAAINVFGKPFNRKRFGKMPFQGPVPEFKPENITRKK